LNATQRARYAKQRNSAIPIRFCRDFVSFNRLLTSQWSEVDLEDRKLLSMIRTWVKYNIAYDIAMDPKVADMEMQQMQQQQYSRSTTRNMPHLVSIIFKWAIFARP
jgi:hypothetical protein